MRYSHDVQRGEIGDEVIIQINNMNPNIDIYYAEITPELGSKIAVKLGKPDEEGKFRIRNTFGGFRDIIVYSDLDLKHQRGLIPL